MIDNKYEQIQLPNGCTLYIKDDEVGGRDYFSDEVGGGVHVWNTSIVNQSTLIAAINEENKLSFQEYMKEKYNNWKEDE